MMKMDVQGNRLKKLDAGCCKRKYGSVIGEIMDND